MSVPVKIDDSCVKIDDPWGAPGLAGQCHGTLMAPNGATETQCRLLWPGAGHCHGTAPPPSVITPCGYTTSVNARAGFSQNLY